MSQDQTFEEQMADSVFWLLKHVKRSLRQDLVERPMRKQEVSPEPPRPPVVAADPPPSAPPDSPLPVPGALPDPISWRQALAAPEDEEARWIIRWLCSVTRHVDQ